MKLEVLSDRPSGGSTVLVLVRLTAPRHDTGARRPVNLSLVIDRSSSMRGPRLKQAIDAAQELLGRLGPKDRLSIVGFDANASVICEPGPVTPERRASMQKTLDSLQSGVGTNLGAALRMGANLIKTSFVRNSISRVLLLTDGQASVGVTDHDRLSAMSEAIFKSGVAVTTMGLGQGYDDELLIEMASRGQGGYYYLASPGDIPAAFGRELEGVFSISAQETELKLVPHDDIESLELLHKLDSQPQQDGLLVRVGDLSSAAPRHILFRMRVDEDSKCATAGTVIVKYNDASGRASDAHLVGITLAENTPSDEVHAIVAEDLKLRVANAVDLAWARRSSGQSGHALLALREVHQAVTKGLEAKRCEPAVAEELLGDLANAEIAINEGSAEREKLRRGLREKSQMTQSGHSVLHNLRRDE